jgi:acetyl-CoA carboxylase biotin carboxyl carrier protein
MAHPPQKPRSGAGAPPAPTNGAGSGDFSKVVRELAKILLDTGLTEIEVERGDLRVRVAKDALREAAHAVVAAPAATVAAPAAAAPAAQAARGAGAGHPGAVTSPMVGTVYVAPNQDADPFVKVGQNVNSGDTLLLIEAMKTFNPVHAPKSGKVVEILVQNGQPVEFGEALVVIE